MLRMDIPVFPDRRMFRVHDATVDPDAPGGPLAPLGALMSVNREQMWVGSLQEHIAVRLFLEEWDMAPPLFGDESEDEAKAVIYLRGALSIDMGSARRALDRLQHAGAVSGYVATVVAVEGPGRSLSAGCCGAATDGCRDTGVARPPPPRSGMARRGSS